MADYREIISAYKEVPGGIIEAYHAVQKEYSYIPEDAVVYAAQVFDMPKAKAYGVATFYSYLQVGPRGKNVIRICESAPCHIAGSDKVVAIKMGETPPDGKFTLEFAECVGQCQATPVITINSQPYGDVTADKVAAILAEYK